jgi:hypothetical protein
MFPRELLVFVCLANVSGAFIPSHPLAPLRREGGFDSTSVPVNQRTSPTSFRHYALSGSLGKFGKGSDEAPLSISTIGTAALLIAGTTVRLLQRTPFLQAS